ncbi:hypothetical protein D3C75_1278610 [compost metagenome]
MAIKIASVLLPLITVSVPEASTVRIEVAILLGSAKISAFNEILPAVIVVPPSVAVKKGRPGVVVPSIVYPN